MTWLFFFLHYNTAFKALNIIQESFSIVNLKENKPFAFSVTSV